MRTNRFALLLLLALVGLSAACSRLADRDFVAASLHTGAYSRGAAPADSIVVGSYNIRYGQNVELATREIRDHPVLSTADILLLQEMDGAGTDEIARALGYDFVYYAATIHPSHDQGFGNAILSRWAILEHRFIALPVQSPFPVTGRIAVVALLDLPGGPLMAVSLHTSTIMVERDVRLDQYQSVSDSLQRFEGPVIVGGDFNTPTYDDVRLLRAQMREQGFMHARPQTPTAHVPTWQAGLGIEANLDHFFFRHLALRRNGVVQAATASDHLPIWAVLEVEAATP